MSKTFSLSLCALASLAAPSALAQSFAVLPVVRDAQAPEAQRRAAGEAVASSGALGPGASVVTMEQLIERLPTVARHLADCVEVECGAHLARSALLDFVAVVAVWPAADGGTVSVTLVGPDGTIHEADAPVTASVEQAATTALVTALRLRELGDGVLLRVRCEPPGALVLVDGAEAGVTPYTGAHAAGTHQVEVRLHGRSERREVVLRREPVELDVALGASPMGSDGDRDGAGGGGLDWNPILGTALLVGGVAVAVPLVVALARAGDCVVEDPAGLEGCRAEMDARGVFHRERGVGTLDAVLAGVGGALVAGGVLVFVLRPIGVGVSADATGARLEWSGRF